MKRSQLLLLCCILSALLLGAVATQAGSPWTRIEGSATTYAIDAVTFAGTAEMVVGGVPETATVVTHLVSIDKVGEDGTLHATTAHEFYLANGILTTWDRAILSPTAVPDLYRLNTVAEVAVGTGDYERAEGKLLFHGEVALLGGIATWSVKGKVELAG